MKIKLPKLRIMKCNKRQGRSQEKYEKKNLCYMKRKTAVYKSPLLWTKIMTPAPAGIKSGYNQQLS